MSEKRRIPLQDITTVAASGTVTITLPRGSSDPNQPGLRYHKILLQHGYASGTNTVAAAATNIALVEIMVNNRVQQRFSGTELQDRNLRHGTIYGITGVPNTAPGVTVPIFFAEPWRDDEVDQDALAWKTNLWQQFQIRVTLGAASTPTLVAWAVVDDVRATGTEAIVKVERTQFGPGGTSYDWVNMIAKDFLQAITFYPDSGASQALTFFTFKRGSERLVDRISASANTADLVTNRYTPAASGRTASLFDYIADQDGLLASAIDLRAGQQVIITLEAGSAMSGTITALIDRLGPPD